MGARLWSCGDALSTAAIWGSDSGLVFLLHNQFAVWIPLHITLNIHSCRISLLLLLLSRSTNFTSVLFFFLFILLFASPSNLNLYHSTNIINSHMKLSIIYLSCFFFSHNLSKPSLLLQFLFKMCVIFH